MSTDMEMIKEMLRRQNLSYQTEEGNRIYFGGATIVFDTLGRISHGDGGCPGCPECEELEDRIDHLESVIRKAISVLED